MILDPTTTDEVIDVLCVVDGQSLLAKYPNASETQHQVLNSAELRPYCRMITRVGNALDNNAQDDLVIKAREGDTIRWRATSLTHDEEYKVDITDFYAFEDEATYITKPKQPHPHSKPDLWETTIGAMGNEQEGHETYWLKFKVVPQEGKTGHFDWDPKIVATKR